MTDTIGTYLAAHAAGKALTATIEETYSRIERHNDPALFIAIRSKAEAFAIAERVQASGPERKPLYGVPFVVKDNIDVAGLPTTAACPAFSYRPGKSAFVVEKLERAGAIAIGKTNLDQFATGLVGVRSPYGVPRNALRGDLIPGGSSSGSAAAVGAGPKGAFAARQYGHDHVVRQSVGGRKHSDRAVLESNELISVGADPQVAISIAIHVPNIHAWDREFQTSCGRSKQPFSLGYPYVALRVFIRPECSVTLRAIRRQLFD